MSPAEIDAARKLAAEARARADAATKGPWRFEKVDCDGDNGPSICRAVTWGRFRVCEDPTDEDGEHIAHARDDVPALADALTAALDALAAAEARADAERVYRVVEARYRAAREATDEAIALGDFDRADELSAAALAVARERDDAVDKLRALGVTP